MNGPIDNGTITLRTAVIIAASAITIAMAWANLHSRLASVEATATETAETLDAICERLQCRAKGMRK